jgi:hypothetical protein
MPPTTLVVVAWLFIGAGFLFGAVILLDTYGHAAALPTCRTELRTS